MKLVQFLAIAQCIGSHTSIDSNSVVLNSGMYFLDTNVRYLKTYYMYLIIKNPFLIALNKDLLYIVLFSLIIKKILSNHILQLGKRFPFEPNSISLRIIFLTISLLGFYIISIYRAMLGASLAVRIFKEPVSELEELLLRDKIQLIIVGKASQFDQRVSYTKLFCQS